jgi:hypothetical protein
MLWESLSGRHPFWQTSMLDTARAIEQGAESLASLRPDLPKGLIELVDRSLSLSPSRRPSAVDLARGLRGAATPRRKRKGPHTIAAPLRLAEVGAAALAAAFTGWTAAELPFFPHGWPVGLALLAAGVTALRPRFGLALALAVPVLPLGNVSSGLALLYAMIAAVWLVSFWREPRDALLFVLGVPLSLVGLLGLVPLTVWRLGSNSRRAALAASSVVVAGIVAGVRGASLPFTGVHPPLGLGVAGSTGPLDVAGTLARHALDQPALLTEAGILAAVALALPYAQARGRWGAAGLAAVMLCGSVLAVPAAAALPLVAAAWITAGLLAVRVP